MTFRNKVASALSFAHLAGIGSRARAEDDTPNDNDDKKSKKAKRVDDDEPEKKDQDHEDGDAKGSRAEDGEDDDKAEDDGPDSGDDAEDDEDDNQAKKAKAKADDGDDDDSEMRGNSTAASARRRERARCASIFASKAAGKNPALAANLAFNTSMTRKEALVVLENTPSAATGYPDRQARNPNLGGGGATQASSAQAVTSSWDRAFAKANPRSGQSK